MKRKNDYKYEKWREDVLKRDNNTCQLCGKTGEDYFLQAHHIIKYSKDENLRTNIDNGITLCNICHQQIFNREEEFEKIFKEILKNPIWKKEDIKIKKENVYYKDYTDLIEDFTRVANSIFGYIEDVYAFKVYMYLCYKYIEEYGYAFPSIRTIAAETHISVKKVQSTLKELEELGLISILKFEEKVSNTFPNNIYKVFFPVIFEEKEIFNVPSLTDEQLKQLEDVENKVRKKTLQRDEDIDD